MSQQSATDAPAAPQTSTLLRDVLADLASVLEGIGPADEQRPTPCAAYSVADLRHHVVGWLTAFAEGFSREDGACSDPEAVTVSGTGAPEVRVAAGRLVAALEAGAAERPLLIGGSPSPGDLAARMILWEYQCHGWDLAVATGRAWRPAEQGLEDSLDFAPGMLNPDFQGDGKAFAPRVAVPASEPALERLLGLSGRDPSWSPHDASARLSPAESG